MLNAPARAVPAATPQINATTSIPAQADPLNNVREALKLIASLPRSRQDAPCREWILDQESLPHYVKATLGLPYEKSKVDPYFKTYAKRLNPPSEPKALPETLPRDATLLTAGLYLAMHADKAFLNGKLKAESFLTFLAHHTQLAPDALRSSVQAADLDTIELQGVAAQGAPVDFLPGLQVKLPPPPGIELPAAAKPEPSTPGLATSSLSSIHSADLSELIDAVSLSEDPEDAPLPPASSSSMADAAGADASEAAQPTAATPDIPHAIHTRVQKFQLEDVENYIRGGGPVDVRDPRGHTLLHFACNRKPESSDQIRAEKKIFKLLLKAGAAPDAVNHAGETPIDFAHQAGHSEMVVAMLDKLASRLEEHPESLPKHSLCWNLLAYVCQYGNIRLLEMFHQSGLPLTGFHPTQSWLALEHATRFGQAAIVKKLLEWGADLLQSTGSDNILYLAEYRSDHATCTHLLDAFRALLQKQGPSLYQTNRPFCEAAMRIACTLGQRSLVTALLQNNIGVAHTDTSGQTCLHNASRAGARDVVKVLLDANADAFCVDNREQLPLHLAAQEGHARIVNILASLNYNKGVHAVDIDGNTPLHLACQVGHVAAIEALLEARAEVGLANTPGHTPLHLAAFHPDPDVLAALLAESHRYEGCLNLPDRKGNTPLHIACERHGPTWSKALMRAGADPDAVNSSHDTPIDIAIQRETIPIIDEFLEQFQHQWPDRLGQVLRAACRLQQPGLIEHLLTHPFFKKRAAEERLDMRAQMLASRDDRGMTALHIACTQGHTGIVSQLLKAGADRRLHNHAGQTPLMLAKEQGFMEIVSLLFAPRPKPELKLHTAAADGDRAAVEAAAALPDTDINQPDPEHHLTPLRWASFYGRAKIVDLLVARSADVGWMDETGRTALHDAALNGSADTCNTLLDKLSLQQINHADQQGLTPLHCAAQRGQLSAIQSLLQHGADLHCVDAQGMTPLHHAARNGHLDAVNLLLTSGANPDHINLTGRTACRLAREQRYLELATRLRQASQLPGLEVELYEASQRDDPQKVKKLMLLGADPNAPHKSDWRPLHSSASHGLVRVTNVLLTLGAEIDVLTRHNNTPLHKASEKGWTDVIKLLLAHRADPNLLGRFGVSRGLTALDMALRGEHWDAVTLLCEAMGRTVPARPVGYIALPQETPRVDIAPPVLPRRTAGKERIERPQAQYAAPPTVRIPEGKLRVELPASTAAAGPGVSSKQQAIQQQVDQAIAAGDVTELHAALQQANVNAPNARGEAALHRVVQRNQGDLLEVVLEQHPDVNAVDHAGDAALHTAATQGNRSIFRRLLRAVPRINLHVRDRHGNTPGHRASMHGHTDLVLDWRKAGGEIDQRNAAGQTVQEAAVAQGHAFLAARLEPQVEPWQLDWQIDNAQKLAQHLDATPALAAPPANGHTWLHEASATGKPNILDMLLARKTFQVDARTADKQTPLHLACAAGQLKAIQQLVKAKADINAQDDQGMTPLMLACKYRHATAVDGLLRHRKLKIDMQDTSGRTALHWAAEAGGEQIVWALLRKGANAAICDTRQQSPLDLAQGNDHLQVVIRLRSHLEKARVAAQINLATGQALPPVTVDNPQQQHGALERAVVQGDLEQVVALLRAGASLEPLERDGYAALAGAILKFRRDNPAKVQQEPARAQETEKALNRACGQGDVPEMIALLMHGANLTLQDIWVAAQKGHLAITQLVLCIEPALIDARNQYDETALHLAASAGHADVVKILLDRQVSIDAKSQYDWVALHYAAYAGHADVVKILLDRQASIDAKNEIGETALHYAVLVNDVDVVKILLDRQTSIDAKNEMGETALHYAARLGHTDVVKILLNRQASIDAKNEMGETALHYAVLAGDVDVVKILLDRQASIDATTNLGYTALHEAASASQANMVMILLDRQAAIDAKDMAGQTALHYAASSGHADVVGILLERKAKVDAKTKNDETALHYAASAGHADVVKILLDNNAEVNSRKKKSGVNALHLAATGGHADVVNVLLDKWATLVETPDWVGGHRAIYYAISAGHANVVEILLDRRQLISESGWEEFQSLQLAISAGHANVVEVLLKRDQDLINKKTWDGKTALDLAEAGGHANIVEFLLKKQREWSNEQKQNDQDAAKSSVREASKAAVSKKSGVGEKPSTHTTRSTSDSVSVTVPKAPHVAHTRSEAHSKQATHAITASSHVPSLAPKKQVAVSPDTSSPESASKAKVRAREKGGAKKMASSTQPIREKKRDKE
ncbi:MAG TPA: ankyrin repeat domain-containing protein [Burkholderiaceae bacterium]|nr:ankyrin repeat domain-containing protein [Burkholderiaceae bacterium]